MGTMRGRSSFLSCETDLFDRQLSTAASPERCRYRRASLQGPEWCTEWRSAPDQRSDAISRLQPGLQMERTARLLEKEREDLSVLLAKGLGRDEGLLPATR